MILSATRAAHDFECKSYPYLTHDYDIAKLNEPLITRDMTEIAERHHGAMKGLQYALKEASHLEEPKVRKLTAMGLSIQEIRQKIGDVVRYTAVGEVNQLPALAQDMMRDLEAKGYTIYKVDNKYLKPHPETGYKGIHILFVSPYGQKGELQVHSEKSLELKEQGHEAYKRKDDESLSAAERAQAVSEALRIHAQIPVPEGIEQLQSREMSLAEAQSIAEYNQRQHRVAVERIGSRNGDTTISGIISDTDRGLVFEFCEVHKHESGEVERTHIFHDREAISVSEYSVRRVDDQERVDIHKDTVVLSDAEIERYASRSDDFMEDRRLSRSEVEHETQSRESSLERDDNPISVLPAHSYDEEER